MMIEKTSLHRFVSIALIILLVLISVISLTGCTTHATGQVEDKSSVPFYADRVVDVRFVMSEEDWVYFTVTARDEDYVKADMWYDGELIPDIALRPKGNSSLASTIGSGSIRFSLKADLNFFNSARNLDGVKKLNFNNGFSDPTFMREILSYELFEQMGLPTPRAAFVDLWINDTHLGLYTMVEQIDQPFLRRYFSDANGNLYKPEMPAAYLNWTEEDLTDSLTSQSDIVDNLDINLGGGNLSEILHALGWEFATEEEPQANQAFPGFAGMNFGFQGSYLEQMGLTTNENRPNHSALFRLLDVLNNEPDETFVEEIEKVLDIDQVLRFLAVSATLVHLDNYIGMGHNYYLYEVDGKFTIIPWDLNMSFGGFSFATTHNSTVNFRIDEPTSGAVADRPLVARLLAVPAYLEAYHGYITELINGPFSCELMASRIDELAEMIRPYVKADTLKFFSNATFEKSLGDGILSADGANFFQMMFNLNIGLKAFVKERIASIEKQLAGELPSTNNGKGNGGNFFFGGDNNIDRTNPRQ